MNKPIALLLILFAVIANTYSQTSNFVEITVQDTVNLKPVKIEYLITEGSTDYTYDYENNKKEENKYANNGKLASVEKILNSNKFSFSQYSGSKNYKIGDLYNYDLYGKSGSGLLVQLNSVKELENLYNLLKDQKGINGKILDISFESSDNYIETLFKRMHAKALKEAQLLGTLTGVKIGKVISVTEKTSDESYSIMNWYQDLLTLGKYEDGMFGKELTKVYTRKMTFKFEAN